MSIIKEFHLKTLNFLKNKNYNPDSLKVCIGLLIKEESYLLPMGVVKRLTHSTWEQSTIVRDESIAANIIDFFNFELIRLGAEGIN